MKIDCVWEHNGKDTLLYSTNLPGAFARGESLETAMKKLPTELRRYLIWLGQPYLGNITLEIVQEAPCGLQVRDADSDVLFDLERDPLSPEDYAHWKGVALRSAADFLRLYEAIPEKSRSEDPIRTTFYGQVPRTAEEMYQHTKNVNAYYFGEVGVEADNDGDIFSCRQRGFALLEKQPNFLENPVFEGSWGERWTVKKLLRRFLWHDRIHAKAMYRMALRTFGADAVPDIFFFEK